VTVALAARLGRSIPQAMYNSPLNSEPASVGPGKRTLFLAVLAPFGAIALLASPLIIDAARRAAGF
jgi:hypothetical protein